MTLELNFLTALRLITVQKSVYDEAYGLNIMLTGEVVANLALNIIDWKARTDKLFIYNISRLDIAIDVDAPMSLFYR